MGCATLHPSYATKSALMQISGWGTIRLVPLGVTDSLRSAYFWYLLRTTYMEPTVLDNKEIVKDLLTRLPDQVSLQEIAQEIEFIAAVRQGLSELDRGESIPVEQIERELPAWVIR